MIIIATNRYMNKQLPKIEKLLEEFCPQGVEFRTLGEVGQLVGGSGLPKTDFTDSGTACIHYGQIYTHYGVHSDKTISFVSLGSAKKLKKVNQGDLIITKTSEDIDGVCKTVAWLGNDEIVTGGHTAILKHKQNSKYLSYYINGAEEFQIQKRKYTTGVKIKDVSLKNLAKIKIPIPPLTIQKEIVKILDNFTQLEAELEAELEARKKQYEHYREQLLMVNDKGLMVDGTKVEFRALGEVYKFNYGKGNTIPTVGGQYPVYGSNGVVGTHNEFNSENSPVIGHIGAYAGIVNWGHGKHYVTYNGVICKIIADFVTPKYAYYQLLKQDFNSMAHSASQPFVSYDMLNKVLIPIPPLAKQQEIVAILDKFDALVNDISTGLPAEIIARKKQYEYYRNQLLNFKPLETQDAN